MAKSFKKNDMSFLNDDIIKQTLKTELASVRASEELVSKTLAACRREIENTTHAKKSNILPWVYRLTPIAAGALVLVLALNSPLMRTKNTAQAPMASIAGLAPGGSAALDDGTYNNDSSVAASANPEISYSEKVASAEPSPAPSEAPAPDVSEYKGAGVKSFELAMGTGSSSIEALNSYVYHASNSSKRGASPSMDVFNGIVDEYNIANSTSYSLDESDVTRINALHEKGVSPEELKKTKSFRSLLSGEGYWSLPLEDEAGNIQIVLAVTDLSSEESDAPVSGSEIIYRFDDETFIATVNPDSAFIGENFQDMFGVEPIIKLLKTQGYEEIYSIVIADVNYSRDFIAFVDADGKELAIPFLINFEQYGLTNGRIYTAKEVFKTISENLSKQKDR